MNDLEMGVKSHSEVVFLPHISHNQPTIAKQLKEVFIFPIMMAQEGGESMQVEIKVDDSYTEPKIIILTAAVTEEVNVVLKKLSDDGPQIISGSRNEKVEVLEQADLFRIYANAGKVYAVTEKGEYTLRLRLYELEERLDVKNFVRISNSEIINLKKVDHFDLSFTGTICVKLSNGEVTYVSRRYVSKIKKILGL